MDYAYTIQGWLKSINGNRTDTTLDMGGDGKRVNVTPKDVYATVIDYFNGDYQSIGSTAMSTLPATTKSLYNGNIARQTTDVTPFGALTANYTYDQMNRIRKANYATENAGVLSFNNWYASAYKYDLDGNIKMLTRKEGSGTTMDSLVYSYPNATQNNKLTNVLDYASYSPSPSIDLPQYTNTSATRFTYDADGNLITDLTSATSNIQWNIYGKMTDYQTANGSQYHLGYDASGQRVFKKTSSSGGGYQYANGTYYVRDAQGNILAEYNASSVFNTSTRAAVVSGIRNAIPLNGTATWLTALNSAGYLNNESLSSYVIGLGGSTITHTAGYYLSNYPDIYHQFVTNYTGFLPALSGLTDWEAGINPVADVLKLKMDDVGGGGFWPGPNVEPVLKQLCYSLFSRPNEPLRRQALAQLADLVPDIKNEIMTNYSLTPGDPMDEDSAAEVMYDLSNVDASYYDSRLISFYNSDPNLIMNWLRAASGDNRFFDAGGETWALEYPPLGTSGGYVQMVRDAFDQYGHQAAINDGYVRSLPTDEAGIYGAANSWGNSMDYVTSSAGGESGLNTLNYESNPAVYVADQVSIRGAEMLDDAVLEIPDGEVNLFTLASSVGVSLSTVQYNSALYGTPYLEKEIVSLANHHMYGSSRLGIAQYQPHQFRYIWDFKNGVVDTFGLAKTRAWYSWMQNAPMNAGATSPYGNVLDEVATADHIIGQKQYELVNHLANVQETISDKKFSKDLNIDGVRDEFRAASVMVYDYYPFGMLMPGRSLDTAGLCTTTPVYTEIPHYHWANGGTLSSAGGGGASAYGSVTKTNLSNGGISVSGTSGGITFTISGIPSAYISIQPSLSALIGSTTLTVYPGTATSGTSLGSANITFTSPTASIYLPAGGSTSAPATITVKMEFPSGGSTNSMTIDSIGYQWITLSLGTTLYTQCGSPKDKYEFGFNGQMKSNEIAGIGNHNTAQFWEYDARLGRRWNLDPVIQPWESAYATFGNNPLRFADPKGALKLDPALKKWKNIYTYLSTDLYTDVMVNCLILGAYHRTFKDLTDEDVAEVFRNNSGPPLVNSSQPGPHSWGNPTAYTNIGDNRTIEINDKLFDFVEAILANSNSSYRDRYFALALLVDVIIHESGHDLEKRKEYQDNAPRSKDGAGPVLEWYIFDISGHSESLKNEKSFLDLDSHNDKFKPGVFANAIDRKHHDLKFTIPSKRVGKQQKGEAVKNTDEQWGGGPINYSNGVGGGNASGGGTSSPETAK